ncbi:MAG: hypothetical protein A4E66_00047 [Syntrophus sp. PtaB.Bin001]|nr:MAG: hypothetical protein A4E66_00047 [Syntrophus sp. PtaB.Bin001]
MSLKNSVLIILFLYPLIIKYFPINLFDLEKNFE